MRQAQQDQRAGGRRGAYRKEADIGSSDEVKIRDGNIFVHEKLEILRLRESGGFRHHDLIAELFWRLDRHPRQAFTGKSPLIQERQPALRGICRSVLLPERH